MSRLSESRIFALLALVVLVLAFVALPIAAQDTSEDGDTTVMITGPLTFSNTGDILVGDYVIAPAGAFLPSRIDAGDVVIIVGRLLPDGITVQAISLELFVDEDDLGVIPNPEATPEPEATEVPEATAVPEATDVPEATPEPDGTCDRPGHPVAASLAEGFEVDYDTIIQYHCAGFGFGEIARAYLLARETGEDVDTFFERRRQGEGWGLIVRESGVHPSELAPGRVIGKGHRWSDIPEATDVPDATAEPDSSARGNGNANGQGNGGGNGNANGQGNGGGNGNANGQGNGGGNGNANGQGNGGGNGNANGQGNGNGGGRGNGNGQGNGNGGGRGNNK